MIRNDLVSSSLMFGAVCIVCIPPFRMLRAEEATVAPARKIVAKVDDKPIYDDRVTPKVQQDLSRLKKYGMQAESPAIVERLKKKVLDKVIAEELIVQASQRLPIEDIEAKITAKMRALERKYGKGKGFEEYLQRNKLTMEGMRSSLRARIHVDEYLKVKGISEPKLPEERIREVYERDTESYAEEERIMVGHILVAAADGDDESDASGKAREKAQEIHKKLLEGGDFAAMAKEHSDCNSASGGGNLGYIKKGYMPDEFDRVAFAMEKDAISDVVKTKFGYHIIKVLDKKPARITPYEEVRGFIEKYLQEEESKKKLAKHIAELREKAKIEIYE